MNTSSRDVDPSVVVAREGRKGQVWAAAITGLAGVAAATVTFFAGLDAGREQRDGRGGRHHDRHSDRDRDRVP